MRLLILEDDPKLLAILSHHFTVAGHDVRTATSLRQATTALATAPADIVITDWKVSEASGKELCRALRKACAPRMHLIMLTAAGAEASASAANSAGADEYVSKPFELHRLVTCVRSGVMQMSARLAA